MNGPLITFGLTLHRRPGYVLQAAGSILAQTYTDWECLLAINDADAEAPQLIRMANLLCRFDARFRRVDCPGCMSGWAKGQRILAEARGEWIAALDYDDIAMPCRLERQVLYLDCYDVVSAQGIYFGKKDGERIPVPSGELRRDHFRHENPVVSPTALYRRADALRLADPKYEFGPADYKFWVDLFNEGKRFFALPDVLALHRLADDSVYNARMDQNVVRQIGEMVCST